MCRYPGGGRDADGCSESTDNSNEGTDDCGVNCDPERIAVAEAFTPNGDGINDGWVIKGIENYPNSVVKVYNRWGHEVYSEVGYQNDWGAIYKDNSKKVPPGSYYYVINLSNGSAPQDGWIFINY